MVVGVDWLQNHSPVQFNFQKMQLTLLVGTSKITLQAATSQADLQLIFAKKLTKWMKHSNTPATSQLFSLQSTDAQPIYAIPGCHPNIFPLLQQFLDIFTTPTELPPSRNVNHTITLKPEAVARKFPPYRHSYSQKQEIEKIIAELLNSGFIQPSQSAFASPVILVKKKDGTWRFCVDYRYLNELTVKHDFPIPIVDDLLDEFHGAIIFSKIDLRSDYYQIKMHMEDISKTAFETHQGHYEFVVMSFGLSNAPATFQSIMNHVFNIVLRKFVLVLTLLREHKLFAKPSKCTFGQSHIEYLGHIIFARGVQADPSKIEAMISWSKPNNLKSLRGFLGLTRYYRKFVQNYALPDFTKPFVIETDASGKGYGAVLLQEQKPLAYISKAWGTI
ncbi:hypothetical protein LIER_05336 [Lithospermum erythrorhizon]|uniref:Uncharacterized protein n=1 Tax=Lithospermum erythrorhizon TaxID=34254 RepID=A0AAV3P488_LITER